jgi:hypothetical protein
MARNITNKLLEMLDNGAIDARVLAECCLGAMSEEDVADMAYAEGFMECFDEDVEYDEEDEDDDR